MNYLQYTSREMFSSTELIRKSKMVFEQLNNKEIQKAIILRDGKPSFLLLDFDTYEKIMTDYINLKSQQKNNIIKNEEKKQKEDQIDVISESTKDIDDKQLQKALEEIENITFSIDDSNEKNTLKQEEKSLKEFWD